MFGKALRRQTAMMQLAKVRMERRNSPLLQTSNSHLFQLSILSEISCYFNVCMCLLLQGARSVLRGSDSVTSILNDWRSIDFESAASQVVFPNQFSEQTTDLFKECKYYRDI